jgi:hypothetical protein
MSWPPDEIYLKKADWHFVTPTTKTWKGSYKGKLSESQARKFDKLISELNVDDFTMVKYILNDDLDASRIILGFADGQYIITRVDPKRYYSQLSVQLLLYYVSTEWDDIKLYKTDEKIEPVLEIY